MKTQRTLLGHPLKTLTFALACASLMTGCFTSSDDSNGGGKSALAGSINGDGFSAKASAAGFQGTVVTAYSVSSDGSLGSSVGQATADAQGSFRIETSLSGDAELVLRAVRDSQEWKAHFEGTLTAGKTDTVQPLSLESSIETDVYLKMQQTAEGREVRHSEVNLAIDSRVAASGQGRYRGAAASRDSLVANLTVAIREGSRARRAFLDSVSAQFRANRTRIEDSMQSAERRLSVSLYAAGSDSAQVRSAEDVYAHAVLQAYVSDSVERTSYARSNEAAYRAMIQASAQLSDSARTSVARGYVRVMATASDTAMQNEFRTAGASEIQVSAAAAAGARFRNGADTAHARASLDTLIVRYRSETRAAFDSSFAAYAAATTSLAAVLDSLSLAIWTQIGSQTDGQAVGRAYATAHVQAAAQIQTDLQSSPGTSTQKSAAAQALAYLTVGSP